MHRSWHSRPILAPFIYSATSMVAGSLSYSAAFLLMGRIRYALCAMLVTDVAVTFYLVMCGHQKEERAHHG